MSGKQGIESSFIHSWNYILVYGATNQYNQMCNKADI